MNESALNVAYHLLDDPLSTSNLGSDRNAGIESNLFLASTSTNDDLQGIGIWSLLGKNHSGTRVGICPSTIKVIGRSRDCRQLSDGVEIVLVEDTGLVVVNFTFNRSVGEINKHPKSKLTGENVAAWEDEKERI